MDLDGFSAFFGPLCCLFLHTFSARTQDVVQHSTLRTEEHRVLYCQHAVATKPESRKSVVKAEISTPSPVNYRPNAVFSGTAGHVESAGRETSDSPNAHESGDDAKPTVPSSRVESSRNENRICRRAAGLSPAVGIDRADTSIAEGEMVGVSIFSMR
jgi:hypothetical protein